MEQTVMDLNDPSEPMIFVNTAIEHYTLDSYFGDFPTILPLIKILIDYQKLTIVRLSHFLDKLYIIYLISI